MAIQPNIQQQEVLAETFRRSRSGMTKRELVAESTAAVAFAAAAVALWIVQPPHGLALGPAAVCTIVLALATRVRFETPFGFTVPSQLAFVPLLFAVPIALVPIATFAALALARLPEIRAGEVRPSRLLQTAGNAWFAIGPVAVFALTGVQPRAAGIGILAAALGAQFLVDFAVSVFRDAVGRGASLRAQLCETWVYVVDAAFSGVALQVAYNLYSGPAAALTLVPLLGLLAMFARERHQRLESLLELNSAYRGTALVLGDVLEADDGYTGEHSKGVVGLVLAVADELQLTPDRRRNLEFAALLHDVGKIAIPKDIVNKPGKLNPEEWALIKTHTIEGQKMLDRVGGFMRAVGQIVRSHHEHWDGGGYPDGLHGDVIPLESRIIACCDTWNAMRTDRCYRRALSHEAALAELHSCAGSQLDPRIVEILGVIVAPAQPGTATPRTDVSRSADLVQPVAGAADVASSADAHRASPISGSSEFTAGGGALEDVRAEGPVERLLEDSWDTRSQQPARRELLVEAGVGALFVAVAVPFAIPALVGGRLPLALTLLLVGLYAVVARMIKFPIGAGYVVPSYLVLVPMLLLLPPSAVPLLVAVALIVGAGVRWVAKRGTAAEMLFSIPDAAHALGPALVLSLAGPVHGVERVGVYLGALVAGFLVDLVVSTGRESLAGGIAPRLQGRVIAAVWLVDACIAPLGFLVARAAYAEPAAVLLLVPLVGLLVVADRDRSTRIAESQRRLGLVARERTRLQAAVHRLGDAFAANVDLGAVTEVLLEGSVDALDADAGRLVLDVPPAAVMEERSGASELEPLLQAASAAARSQGRACVIETDGIWALALPLALGGGGAGALAVARRGRAFRADEQALMRHLAERAQHAAIEILAHEVVREEAMTDPLTQLGNRRKLSADLSEHLNTLSVASPLLLMLFDLDGFKSYNDTFGHVAGDALLARLGQKLAAAVAPRGSAYRLGGDEFCVLLPARRDELHDAVAAAAGALEEHGDTFEITASCGTVVLPHEAQTVDYAVQLADERMYARKHGRRSGAGEQARDVLLHILRAKKLELPDHANDVARLAVAVGRRLKMNAEQLDELERAATLHDVGKVGLPDAILTKQGPLDPDEWNFVRQHTVLGERILGAAPALRPVATIVRASHERWDGGGYPDGLRGEQIPLAARIISVCDAYHAITSDRCYRPARSDELAREEIRSQAGHQFDPAVVAPFLQELERPTTPAPSGPAVTADKVRTNLAATVVSHVHELLESPA